MSSENALVPFSRRRWLRGRAMLLTLALALPALDAGAAGLEPLRQEASALGELVSMERRLSDLELRVGKAHQDESDVREAVERAQRLANERLVSLRRVRAATRVRLRALLRGERRGLLSTLLGARHLSDFRKRRRAEARALRADTARLQAYRTELLRVRALQDEVRTQQARAAKVRERIQGERDALRALRTKREETLAALRKRGLPGRLARAERRRRARLQQLVASLRGELRAARSPERLRGRLPHPVDGPVTVPFGPVREPPFGAVNLHAGWRYRAAVGTPVRAIYSGRVVFARAMAGYGNLVIIDHGGRVHSLVAHLSRIDARVGQDVRTGEPLGLVGGESTLRGPGLYFELRSAGRPIDPARWLRPRERDERLRDGRTIHTSTGS